MSWLFGGGKEADIFYCQLAHGSPIGLITNFKNAADLYSQIAKCYDINVFDILYCTLNTHKVDMTQLLVQPLTEPINKGIIFAHKKGYTKIIEITKTKGNLGASLISNGNGFCIIQSIEPGSDLHATPQVSVGDHIQEINDINVLGKTVDEIKFILRAFVAGSTFALKLIEPLKPKY